MKHTENTLWERRKKIDNINPHYYTQGIDCIDYITSKDMSFLEGNVVKYVTRYRMKNGIEDLMKAQWYLTKLIEDYNKKGEVK